ncbi:MAG: hypothetical protein JWP81_841 [Ferruginibacter sp.]|nr:hypothetical protein [Ferruginibacter sp.]
MITHEVFIKNLQCGNCYTSINTILRATKGVVAVEFFKEENKINISSEKLDKAGIITSLQSIGYHEDKEKKFFSKKNSFEYWYCHCCSGCD